MDLFVTVEIGGKKYAVFINNKIKEMLICEYVGDINGNYTLLPITDEKTIKDVYYCLTQFCDN